MDTFTKNRIIEISNKHCSDYPNLSNSDLLTRLWAIESNLAGTERALKDLHNLIKVLRLRCGLTAKQAVELWENTYGGSL